MEAFFRTMLVITTAALAACGKGADGSPQPAARAATAASSSAAATRQERAPSVDRSLPLDRYTELDASDAMAFRYLAAAFRGAPLSDDEKLSLLSVEGSQEHDAFKRKDLLARELPGINARLDVFKAQRYYRIFVYDPIAQQKLTPRPYPVVGWINSLGGVRHYDLDRKGFPAQCLVDGGFGGQDFNVLFGGLSHPDRHCLLSVPDEATARTVEAALKIPVIPMAATLYFHIDKPNPTARGVDATLTHARVQLFSPALSPANPKPLADLDVELPQPVL